MLFMSVENGTDEMASGERLGLMDTLKLQVDEAAEAHTQKKM